jgi:hypothetical protein
MSRIAYLLDGEGLERLDKTHPVSQPRGVVRRIRSANGYSIGHRLACNCRSLVVFKRDGSPFFAPHDCKYAMQNRWRNNP